MQPEVQSRKAAVAAAARAALSITLLGLTICACNDRGGARAPSIPQSVGIDQMRAQADRESDAMASFLSQLITYPTVESVGPTLRPETEAALQAVLDKGREFGFTARRSRDGRVGILEHGEGEEIVGAVVHLDVVPPGDLAQWENPPFSGRIVDGSVWGRGAQDDKGAAVGVLWGAKILIDGGMTFQRRLRLIFATKEEVSFDDI